MRRCLDCNTELPDVALKCTECGSENLSFIEQNDNFKKSSLKGKPKILVILISIILLFGIISSVIAYKYSAKNIPAEPVKKAMASFYSGDLQGYVDEMYNSFQTDAQNYLTNQFGSYESYEQSTKETLENAYGENYKVETKVVDIYSFTDKMIEFLNEACKDSGYKAEISDAKHISVRIITKNDEGAQTYYIADEYSAEIDGKWYFIPKNMLTVSSDK